MAKQKPGRGIAVRNDKKSKALAVKQPDWKRGLIESVKDEQAPEEATVGSKISTKGGKFTFRGMPLNMPLKGIIVAFVAENRYYAEAFDEENPTPPTCYAIGVDEKQLAPEDEHLPDQQADACATCEQNQFGSSGRGRGKACSNRRRVALISADVDDLTADYIETAEIAVMEISPLGLKNWKTYINKIRDGMGTAEQFVITEFDTEQDGSVFKVTAQLHEEIDDKDVCAAILSRRAEAMSMLEKGYDYSGTDSRPVRREKPNKKEGRGNEKGGKPKGRPGRGGFR